MSMCITCRAEADGVFCADCLAHEFPWRQLVRGHEPDPLEREYRFKFDLHVWACGIYNRIRERAQPTQVQFDLFAHNVDDRELQFWDELTDTLEVERHRVRDLVMTHG